MISPFDDDRTARRIQNAIDHAGYYAMKAKKAEKDAARFQYAKKNGWPRCTGDSESRRWYYADGVLYMTPECAIDAAMRPNV